MLSMAAAMLLALVSALPACGQAGERLRVATTTSLYDTRLWGYLELMFQDEYSVELDVIYAGTGKALEWGRRGDVDVIAVHSKAREEQFVAEGHGVERVPFAYNYFLIVGPEADPAGISGIGPEDAFDKLMAEEAKINFDGIAVPVKLPEKVAATCDACHHNMDRAQEIEPAILMALEKFVEV